MNLKSKGEARDKPEGGKGRNDVITMSKIKNYYKKQTKQYKLQK